jgi:hypothetical protein
MYIQNVLQFVKFVLLRYTDFGFFSFPFKLSELGITSINYIFNISFILIFFQFFFWSLCFYMIFRQNSVIVASKNFIKHLIAHI